MDSHKTLMTASKNAVDAVTEAPETIVCQLLEGGESVKCGDQIFSLPKPDLGSGDWEFWLYLGVYIFLVFFAGKNKHVLYNTCCVYSETWYNLAQSGISEEFQFVLRTSVEV